MLDFTDQQLVANYLKGDQLLINDSSEITKSVKGAADDLQANVQIFVGGDSNPDGSYTAKTIQIRQ